MKEKLGVPEQFRQFLYKYLPKSNGLQWLLSLLLGKSHLYQRRKPKYVTLWFLFCLFLVILGIILFCVENHMWRLPLSKGLEGIFKLWKYIPLRVVLRIILIVFFLLV